jgi:hypothetical protein
MKEIPSPRVVCVTKGGDEHTFKEVSIGEQIYV